MSSYWRGWCDYCSINCPTGADQNGFVSCSWCGKVLYQDPVKGAVLEGDRSKIHYAELGKLFSESDDIPGKIDDTWKEKLNKKRETLTMIKKAMKNTEENYQNKVVDQ